MDTKVKKETTHQEKIISLRRKFTQEELSRKIGVTQSTIYTWEHGTKVPNSRLVKNKVAEVFSMFGDK